MFYYLYRVHYLGTNVRPRWYSENVRLVSERACTRDELIELAKKHAGPLALRNKYHVRGQRMSKKKFDEAYMLPIINVLKSSPTELVYAA